MAVSLLEQIADLAGVDLSPSFVADFSFGLDVAVAAEISLTLQGRRWEAWAYWLALAVGALRDLQEPEDFETPPCLGRRAHVS